MQLSKPRKLLIGLATLWPPIYMGIFFSFVFIERSDDDWDNLFYILFALHVFTMAVIFALLVFYCIYLFKYAQAKQETKIIWVLLFLFVGFITFPFFWYLHIWKKRENECDPIFTTLTNHICPKCSSNVSDTWKVCPHCGESLVEILGFYCSKCGKDVEEGWNVCAHCGKPL